MKNCVINKNICVNKSRSSSSASKPDQTLTTTTKSNQLSTTTPVIGGGMKKTESSATTALVSGESRTSSHYHLEATVETSPSTETYESLGHLSSSLESSPDEKLKSRIPKTQLYHFKYDINFPYIFFHVFVCVCVSFILFNFFYVKKY